MTDFMHIYICITDIYYTYVGFSFIFFFFLCNPVFGKYLSVSCEKEIVVSIWYTRVNLHTNWLKIICLFFKLLNCQYSHWFQNINTEKTTSKSLLNLRQYPHCLLKIWELQGIPWQSCDWDSKHPLKEAQVPSLVRKLRSQKLSSSTRKKKKSRNLKFQTLSVYTKWIFVCLSCLFVSNGSSCDALNDYAKVLDRVDYNNLWKILKEMGIPDHLTCLLRNLYAGQEATVRSKHGLVQNWEGSTSKLCIITLLI